MDVKCIKVRAPTGDCRAVPEVLMEAFRNPDGHRNWSRKVFDNSHALRREDLSII